MSYPVVSDEVRELILRAMPLRREGKTTKEIAAIFKMSVPSLYERVSRRSINRHCPDLYKEFADSLPKHEKKEPPGAAAIEKYCTKLCAGESLLDVYNLAKSENGPRATLLVRAAMRAAYKKGEGDFFEYVRAVKSHKIKQIPSPNDSLDIFEVFAQTTKKKTKCESCDKKSAPDDRLTLFCRDKDKGLQTFCRDCLCKDVSDESPLETILINCQNQSVDVQSAYHFW